MKNSLIVIIDYGMGNIRSIENKVIKFGHKAIVSNNLKVIEKAEKIILPGVGHFSNGMRKLREYDLIETLNKKVLVDKIPILGICLGMQLLTRHSEEGDVEGLGWIDADTIRFNVKDYNLKVPHMGWNSVVHKKESLIFDGIPENSYYYFVHSFHVKCNCKEEILTTSYYGNEFVSAIQRENILGTQFHPEKSHLFGEKLLNNFFNL